MDSLTLALIGIALTGLAVVVAIYYGRRQTRIAEEEQAARRERERLTEPPIPSPRPPRPKPKWPRHKRARPEGMRALVGRTALLQRLRPLFVERRGGAAAGIVLVGAGGMGKTALARHYYNTLANEYEGVWWLDGDQIVQGFAELAAELHLQTTGQPDAMARLALNALSTPTCRWLVVIDNADDLRTVEQWTPSGANIDLLVTSRDRDWPPQRFAMIKVTPLPTDDATTLLMAEAAPNDVRPDGESAARKVAAALDGSPLAMVIAGGWLRLDPKAGFAAYETRLAEVIRDRPPADYPNPLYGAVMLSYERLTGEAADDNDSAQTARNAKGALEMLSWLAPTGIHEDLLTAGSGLENTAPLTPDRASRALYSLRIRSLAEADTQGFALHRLVQASVRLRLAEDNAIDQPIARAAAVLEALYPKTPQFSATWAECHRMEMHLNAFMHEARWTAIDPEVLLRSAIFHAAQGRHDLARQVLLAILQLAPQQQQRRKVFDVSVMTTLANVNAAMGDHRMAMETLDAVRRVVEPDRLEDPWKSVFRTQVAQIAIDAAQRAPTAARRALIDAPVRDIQRSCAALRRETGPWGYQFSVALAALSMARWLRGQRGASLRLLRGARRARLRHIPADDQNIGVLDMILGQRLAECGDLEGADEALERAASAFKAAYGDQPHQPDAAQTGGWRAVVALLRAQRGETPERNTAAARALAERHGLLFDVIADRAASLHYAGT